VQDWLLHMTNRTFYLACTASLSSVTFNIHHVWKKRYHQIASKFAKCQMGYFIIALLEIYCYVFQ